MPKSAPNILPLIIEPGSRGPVTRVSRGRLRAGKRVLLTWPRESRPGSHCERRVTVNGDCTGMASVEISKVLVPQGQLTSCLLDSRVGVEVR